MAVLAEKAVPHVGGIERGEILDRIEKIERLDKVARRTFGIEESGSRNPLVSLSFTSDPRFIASVTEIGAESGS